MYNGGMAGFGFIFMLIYLGVIAYFFYLFASIAKSLEKIGARCQSICEYIAYFVKGEDVRHKGEEAMSILLEDMDEG